MIQKQDVPHAADFRLVECDGVGIGIEMNVRHGTSRRLDRRSVGFLGAHAGIPSSGGAGRGRKWVGGWIDCPHSSDIQSPRYHSATSWYGNYIDDSRSH